MALTLNTSHPLFANLKSFICVDGGVIKDLVQTSRTFTPHAAVTYGTNGYGEYFKTIQVANNAQGVTFSPVMETCDPAQKTIIVIVTDHVAVGAAFNIRTNGGVSPGTFWTGSAVVSKNRHASWTTTNGTVASPTMIGFTRTGETASGLIQNGTLSAQGQLYYNGTRPVDYIGGDTTGGYATNLAASYNYVIEFDVALDATQVSAIYSSLGASGAISLLSAAPSGSSASFSVTTDDVVFSGNASVLGVPASATFTAVTDGVVFSGGAATASFVSATFVVTTADIVFSGGASVVVSGSLVSDVLINNTGTVLASQAVHWSWLPSGRIGSLSAVTEVDGTGTTSVGGVLTVTGLPAGAGILLIAKRSTSAADDHVYYQAGTVA